MARCLSIGFVLLVGCASRGHYAAPTTPMPPNTILLSEMMKQLSDRPGFTDALLGQIDRGGKTGAALLTPRLVDRLRELILGKDWQGLNRFPGWTMREITPTVGVIGGFTRSGVEAPSGERDRPSDASNITRDVAPNLSRVPSAEEVAGYIDLGELTLSQAQQVDLDQPSHAEPTPEASLVKPLGDGVVSGDSPDPRIVATHAESVRMAELLNRLSLNGLNTSGAEGAEVATATVGGKPARTPAELMRALVETGHSVRVSDARFFANFGHFHFNGQDVMMPFWVDTLIRVPHTRRPLLVPVSHAEYEWSIRGPRVNADVAFYYGIDGRAEFRIMDELNQPWVLGRMAHVYEGASMLEVTRLTGEMVVAYIHQHVARPKLPFGGYYTLGVCQDSVAAIERHMTGTATLFPNTADVSLFNDPRDAEVNGLIAAIPKDRGSAPPDVERVFGSLPTADLHAITIPGLADDLIATEAAWHEGRLRRIDSRQQRIARTLEAIGIVLALLVAAVLYVRRSRAGR